MSAPLRSVTSSVRNSALRDPPAARLLMPPALGRNRPWATVPHVQEYGAGCRRPGDGGESGARPRAGVALFPNRTEGHRSKVEPTCLTFSPSEYSAEAVVVTLNRPDRLNRLTSAWSASSSVCWTPSPRTRPAGSSCSPAPAGLLFGHDLSDFGREITGPEWMDIQEDSPA